MAEQAATEQPSTGSEASVQDRFADQLFGSEQPEEQEETPADSAAPEESAQPKAEEKPEAPALEEVEWEGVKLGQYPKETAEKVRSALMAQQDYTVKTQEVAEQRRMVEMRAQAMQHEAQFQQSISQELSQIGQLDAQIAAYKDVNWSALDAQQMMQAKIALDTLKEQRQELVQQVEGKRGQFDQKIIALRAEARTKGNEYLKKHIPNWGPDVQKELHSYGVSEGYSEVELANVNDPRVIRTLHKASQWDKLQSQKGKALQPTAKVPPVVRPGATSNQTAKATAENAYRKALREAKSPGERQRIIQERFASKLG